ncbi:MAG: hypothetical protein GEV08_13460 [Acidimicrobiia bacterium]|nr:hypothetical protein [Acidimicrobiia bacterium]
MSVQQAANQVAASQMLTSPLEASLTKRIAGGVFYGGIDVKLMWPCADGHASVTFLFGAAIGPFTRRLMEWVYEEGFCDAATRDKDWVEYTMMLLDGREPLSEYERIRDQVLTGFFASKTKAELLDAAVKRRVLVAPVATTADVLANPQLAARGYWETVEMGAAGGATFPGAMAKPVAMPLEPLPGPPALGEHTEQECARPGRRPVVGGGTTSTVVSTAPALAGLKVLGLMWVMAGPAPSRVLADYGADVIRVESTTTPGCS